MLSSHLRPRSHSHVPNALLRYFSNSQVETTITRHSELPPPIDTPRLMVVKQGGKSSPQNPSNDYISKYPDGFFGYLGCGSSTHRFRQCKDHSTPVVRKVYRQELWDRVPHTREKMSPPFIEMYPVTL